MRYGFLEKDSTGNNIILRPKLNQKLTLSPGFQPIFVVYGFRESILKWFRKHGQVHIELASEPSGTNSVNKLTFDFQRVGKFTLTPWRCIIRGTVDQDYDRFDFKSNLPKRDLPIILKSGVSFGEAADLIEGHWKHSKHRCTSSLTNTDYLMMPRASSMAEDLSSCTHSTRHRNRYTLQADSIICSPERNIAPPPYTARSESRQSLDSTTLPSYNSTQIHCRVNLETLSVLIQQYSHRH
ncbi:hypothetical protein K493DRAFT_18528 [Basidiobolus meristosporus CBS 931.73]|uniref:Uncharacterized protein n=1 Tax=Basidiobolus meristosporus CBS 931.73 TaxID=1314790 RepID=A0A1Y1Z8M2_9FUNG|nr:hypothetical protein K493DRAFT_18528 [Basidiobolus meristosporus CBS 931.73]|eukprot:ORY06603.1 hypothetical protein K493DRAFT_18528 [Basidiobolus meristosporus CBS 931.73]